MNKIRQHRPAFFSGDEAKWALFSNFDELRSIDWVARFRNNSFERYSLSVDTILEQTYYTLMAEYSDGKNYVVGFLDEDVAELPRFVRGLPEDAEPEFAATPNYGATQVSECRHCGRPVYYDPKDSIWLHRWGRWKHDNGYRCSIGSMNKYLLSMADVIEHAEPIEDKIRPIQPIEPQV